MKGSFLKNEILKLILIFLQYELVHTYFNCGANLIKTKPLELSPEPELNKMSSAKATASEYQPIKIGFDFSSFIKPSSMSDSVYSQIKNIIKDTAKEFKKFLQVVHKDYSLGNKTSSIIQGCGLTGVSKNYQNFLIDNDLIIFPSLTDQFNSSTLAGAAYCIYDSKTGKIVPKGGILKINQNINFNKKNSDLYLKQIIFHEITHVLIFEPKIIRSLNALEQRNDISYVNSTKVLEKARDHFNCHSLSGVPLENQGGKGSVGSHWESRYMLGDYMISTAYIDSFISDITLALFETHDYYKVNYYSGNLFKFGKNKGCDFLNEKCIKDSQPLFDEFCVTKNEPKCTYSRTMKAKCYIIDYADDLPPEYQYFSNPKTGGFTPTDYCPISIDFSSSSDQYPMSCKVGTSSLSREYNEYIGDNSFCFLSSLLPSSSSTSVSSLNTICYQVECDSSNKNIIVKVGSNRITCPTEGGNLTNPSGFKGNIECPKYEDICPQNNDVSCTDTFDCLTKNADKDGVSYNSDIKSYDNKEETNDDDDENITPIRRNAGSYIKSNSIMLIIIYLFFY